MLAQAAPWPLLLGLPLALLLLLGIIFVGLRWALGRVAAALGAVAPRRLLILLGGVTFAAYLVGLASPGLAWGPGFSRPVSLALAEQLRLVPKPRAQASDAADHSLGRPAPKAQARAGAPGPPPSPRLDSDLGRVRGAHVVILFAESYGAATFDQPHLAAALAPARADLAAALAETGRGAVSAWVRSPTFAGGSWLAHASLLAGVEVRGDDDYNRLLTQSRETLVQPFARAGYRTLGVMPGLQVRLARGCLLWLRRHPGRPGPRLPRPGPGLVAYPGPVRPGPAGRDGAEGGRWPAAPRRLSHHQLPCPLSAHAALPAGLGPHPHRGPLRPGGDQAGAHPGGGRGVGLVGPRARLWGRGGLSVAGRRRLAAAPARPGSGAAGARGPPAPGRRQRRGGLLGGPGPPHHPAGGGPGRPSWRRVLSRAWSPGARPWAAWRISPRPCCGPSAQVPPATSARQA